MRRTAERQLGHLLDFEKVSQGGDGMPLLKPGVVLLATDARVSEETTGGKTQVFDSDPPSA